MSGEVTVLLAPTGALGDITWDLSRSLDHRELETELWRELEEGLLVNLN